MIHQNSSSFGALLNAFRKRRHLTQQQLARAIGVHRNAIGRWEQGDFLPESKTMVLELIRALHLDDLEGRHLLEASFTALAPLWNVPYQRNPFFTGRNERLDSLHQCLNADRAIALTQAYALHGLGGIGKTQVAVEYAYRHALEYTAILWIRAETDENIIASFLHIAELLHLPERQEANQQRVIVGVQHWLTSQSGWLLIWDNLEDIEALLRYLPPTHQGAVLITTRCQSLGTMAQGIELLPMAQEEAVLFLLRRAKILTQQATSDQVQQLAEQRPTDYTAAEELVRVMGGLPLALDQVGAYMEETACGVTGYLHLYRKQCRRLLDRRGTPVVDHPQSTTATLLLAYERVEQANAAAAELICLCAFLHPDAIPEELIGAGAALLGPTIQAIAHDPYQLDQAIAVLRTYSLISRSSETQTLTIHRLVQTVLKEHMDASTFRKWSERTVSVLNAIFPDGKETKTWSQCQRYLAHVEVCSLLIEQWKLLSPEAGRLLHEAGVYSRIRAQYAQAERWLVQAHAIRQQARGTEHSEVAESLNELAMLYRSQGKYKEAEPLFLRALTIREHQLGAEHPELASSLNGLARLYADQGNMEKAEPLFLRALMIQEHQLEAEHPDTAETLNNLASLYWARGKYREAEPLFLRALQIWERQLGAEHPDVARSLHNLALVYWSWERYREAEPLFLRALMIQEHQLGAEHPDVAIGLNTLAVVYWSWGRYREAEPLFLRALQIWERQLGTEHPEIVSSLNGLARLYADQRKHEEAEPLFLHALTIQKHRLEAKHPVVPESLNGLASLYWSRGRYREAEPLFLCALRIWEHQLGAEHHNVARSLNTLAMMYWSWGRYREAEPLFLRALTIRERQLGTEHPEIVSSLNGLARLYADQRKHEEAEPLFLRALMIQEHQLGAERPAVAESLNGLARLYADQGKYEEAEPLFLRALMIQEHQLGAEHPDTVTTLTGLKSLYTMQD